MEVKIFTSKGCDPQTAFKRINNDIDLFTEDNIIEIIDAKTNAIYEEKEQEYVCTVVLFYKEM